MDKDDLIRLEVDRIGAVVWLVVGAGGGGGGFAGRWEGSKHHRFVPRVRRHTPAQKSVAHSCFLIVVVCMCVYVCVCANVTINFQLLGAGGCNGSSFSSSSVLWMSGLIPSGMFAAGQAGEGF